MEFSEFRIIMEESQRWVEQKLNNCLPEETYNPKIKDFLNAWEKVNEFASPHEDSDELPQKIKKIP